MADHALKIGDAHNVVVEIALDRQGLDWLIGRCPYGDGFTDDLEKAARQLDEEAEQERRDIEEFGRPALAILFDGKTPRLQTYVTHDPDA